LAPAQKWLAAALGHECADPALLTEALTHRSHGGRNNERLEFLGDAVLSFVVAELLFREFPAADEGELSRYRASLVSGEVLGAIALDLGLGDHVRLGEGELKSGGFRRKSILADALEAVLGAIYLDGGIEAARAFIDLAWRPLVAEVRQTATLGGDHKSALQEWLQATGRPLPAYRIALETGPDHEKHFHVDAVVDGIVVASGTGKTKKEAEQEAARLAITALAGPTL
jgi:ribonuclease III